MFDKEDYIWTTLQREYRYLESSGLEVIAVFLQGSQNYNLDIYDDTYFSDIDIKAIVALSIEDIVDSKNKISFVVDYSGDQSEGQIEVKDIRSMLEMWEKQNQTYLEILFTDYYIINPHYYAKVMQILNMRNEIVKMNQPRLIKCITGMAKEKFETLSKDRPSVHDNIETYGYDPKQLASLLRLEDLLVNLFEKNKNFKDAIYYNDETYREGMIKTKKGFLSLEDAEMTASKSIKNIEAIKEQLLKQKDINTFDKESSNKLKEIVRDIIRYSIIKQSSYLVSKEDKE